ncbi:MAG: rhodanese-like domain-containing protein [Rhodobacteraceae bacterium]|nr:MAG: rhodanese-like domain-containing protein [Paracoccaceae bacterium]
MRRFFPVLACLIAAAPVLAQEPVHIRPDLPSVTVDTPTGPVEISRNQDPQAQVSGEWARTSRPCPPFCVQPMSPADGVRTIGELELLEMLQDPEAVVIDSRTADWFAGGSIPGAINLPWDRMAERLDQVGCELDFDGYICGEAVPEIALFCNGPWCGQSPTAIRRIIEAGYPAEKISYYRGGMQIWRLLGFTVTAAE